MQRLLTVLVAALLFSGSAAAQSVAERLQKGIYTQDTVGDVEAALTTFREILKTPSVPRRYAAQAQARIVRCLVEKGDTNAASREFTVLTRDYAEFRDVVATAATALRGRQAVQVVQLPSAPTRITSSIRGRVTDDGGRPLRAAQVRLSGAGIEPRTVGSDSDGHYELGDMRAGRYTVAVSHAGYLPLRYGQRRPRELGRLLDISDGQTIENVDFMLPRMGVITGRVLDEMKEPIAGVAVLAMRWVYFGGRRQLMPAGGGPLVRTDDAGEFRLNGLSPGTYVVLAKSDETWSVDEAGVEQIGYAPTFFPGTTAPSTARDIGIGIGQEVANIDIPLTPMRTATITGTAVDSRGQPLQTVILAQEIRGEAFGLFGAAARASVGSDGRFTLPHVAAGEYKLEGTTLSASGNAVEPPEVAIMPITVNGEDVAGVSLVGSTGGFVSGRLVSDSGSLPNPRDIRIRIGPWFAPRYIGQSEPLKLGTFGGRGGVDYADVREDGTFVLNHAFGPARVQVTLPDGWTVKAIRHDEADLTDAELNFTNGQRLTDISIVMTQRITTLTGQVKDEHNMPTTSGTVVVFSTNQEKLFEQSRHIRAARPDQHGGYKIQGLPAGEYFVAAVDDVDEGDWWDPEFLNRIRPSAIRVMLAESGNVVQTLTLSGR